MSTTKTNHALENAINHLYEMVKNYEIGSYIEQCNPTTQDQEEKLEEIREDILNSALSVEFRSGWATFKEDFVPEEFKILLTWGGPALRVIGELDDNGPVNPKLQYQDWGTFWTDFETTENEQDALNWFCNCFYFGG